MSVNTVSSRASKKRVLVDSHVRAEFPDDWYMRCFGRSRTAEDIAKHKDELCREFHDFIRDHRSQDRVELEVVREYEDQCSACGGRYEPLPAHVVFDPDDYNGDPYRLVCASCGEDTD